MECGAAGEGNMGSRVAHLEKFGTTPYIRKRSFCSMEIFHFLRYLTPLTRADERIERPPGKRGR